MSDDNEEKTPHIDFSKLSKFLEQNPQEHKNSDDLPLLEDLRGWGATILNISLNEGNGYAAVQYRAHDDSTGAFLLDPSQIPGIVNRLLEVALLANVINPPVVTKVSKIDSREYEGEICPFLFHFNGGSWWQYFLAPPEIAKQASALFEEMDNDARRVRTGLGVLDEFRTKH